MNDNPTTPEECADELRRARFHERENYARWQEAKAEAEHWEGEHAALFGATACLIDWLRSMTENRTARIIATELDRILGADVPADHK